MHRFGIYRCPFFYVDDIDRDSDDDGDANIVLINDSVVDVRCCFSCCYYWCSRLLS